MDTSNLRFILIAAGTFAGTFAAVSLSSSLTAGWVAKPPMMATALTPAPQGEQQAEPPADTLQPERVALLQTDPEPSRPQQPELARQTDPVLQRPILQPPMPQPRPALAPARAPAAAPQAAREPARDQLAITTVAAASAYTRTPCDSAARAAFIVAASTYLRAKSGDADASSPSDTRAYQAIKVAMAGGGLRRDDFPPGTDLTFAAGSRTRGNMACASSAALQRR